MKRTPAWVPYAIGAAVVAGLGYLFYRKLAVKLPAVGQAVSSEFIDIFKPKGVSNTAQSAPVTLPASGGKPAVTFNVSPDYQAAINGFVAANPQLSAQDVVKKMIAVAWKIGDPTPPGLNPYQ